MVRKIPIQVLLTIAHKSANVELITATPHSIDVAKELYPILPSEVVNHVVIHDRLDVLTSLMVEFSIELTNQLMDTALRSGSMEIVRFLRLNNLSLRCDAINLAAESGNIQLIRYLISQGLRPTESTYIPAIKYGRFDVIEFLTNLGVQPNEKALKWAGHSGRIDVLEYAIDQFNRHGCELSSQLYEDLIEGNHLEEFKWLIERYPPEKSEMLYDLAYGLGRKEFLPLFPKQRPSDYAFQVALRSENLEVIEEFVPDVDNVDEVLELLTASTNLEVLKYLKGRDVEFDVYTVAVSAAREGKIEVLKWLIETYGYLGYQLLVDAMAEALENNQPEAFMLLFNEVPEYHLNILNQLAEAAASGGNIELVEFLLNHIPSNEQNRDTIAVRAAVHGHLWLVNQIHPETLVVPKMELLYIIQAGNLNTLKAVSGELPHNSLQTAIEGDNLHVAMYLALQGHKITTWYTTRSLDLFKVMYNNLKELPKFIDPYIEQNNYSVIELLMNKGYKFNKRHLAIAIAGGHLSIVKLLYGKGYKVDVEVISDCIVAEFIHNFNRTNDRLD